MTRAYTQTPAAIEQRRAAAKRPRGGAREWTNVRVSTGVLAAIDRARGERSRNDYLAEMMGVNERATK